MENIENIQPYEDRDGDAANYMNYSEWVQSDGATMPYAPLVDSSGARYAPTDKIPTDTFPDTKTNAKGDVTGLKATNENLNHLFEGYGIQPSYDVHNKEAHFDVPGLAQTDYGQNDVAIGEITSKSVRCGLPVRDLQKSILDAAYKNPAFPIRDYLNNLRWDGNDHINALCDTLRVPEEFVCARNTIILLWLIQCAAAADGAINTPNKSALARFEYVLVLGGKQGLNKTKWFRSLVPHSLRKYFKNGVTLDPNDRDSVKRATSFWLVEIGEIDATFRHADLARLKAFLSEEADVYRVSYGRTENSYPRMTSFCGSVNEMRFLKDATGNRRYWPITPHTINLPQDSGVDMSQVWAQAWHLYKTGSQWWPTDSQELAIQATRETVEQDHETAIGEMIFDYFGECTLERKSLPGNRCMKMLEIARDIGITKPSQRDYTDIRNWLERNNLNEHERPDSITHARQTKWLMPPRCTNG